MASEKTGYLMCSKLFLDSDSLDVVSSLAATASPGDLLEMQILDPHSRLSESNTLGMGLSSL